jgi:hypothetical protein
MKIHSGLSEGQVLQRLGLTGAALQLEGTCAENGAIQATISCCRGPIKGWKSRQVGRSAGGQFSVTLSNIPVGGPYQLDLRIDQEKAIVKLFFVGDVWVLAGQSNMEGAGDMTRAARPHPLIRMFSMRREWARAREPMHVREESPDACHHEGAPISNAAAWQRRREAPKGVGPGLYFAREMFKRSGVPQGLICTAHGGTSMIQWNPEKKDQAGASLYGSMMISVTATKQPVAGMLWYQGESEATEVAKAQYTVRMKKLVTSVRRDLRLPKLPWIMVQIARVFGDLFLAPFWNDIQEQQRLLPGKIDNIEVVAAIDLPLDDIIHIGAAGFARLGMRMARAADRLVHKNNDEIGSPQLRKVRLSRQKNGAGPTTIDVIYDKVAGSLRAAGESQGFTVLQENGTVWPWCYKTTLHGNVVRLHLDRRDRPMLLHYGHGGMPFCNITDGRDMSLPVFGPLRITKLQANLPFVTRWKVTGVISSANPLHKISCPVPEAFGAATKAYGADGLINEWSEWQGKSGQAYFSSQLDLPESMKLLVLMGYDGPFRMWIDEASFFSDLKGTNPCVPDKSSKSITLKAGLHRLVVAMDLNQGKAWGFMLRFVRQDVARTQLEAQTYLSPKYLD